MTDGASLALKGWEAMTRLLLAEAWMERARVWRGSDEAERSIEIALDPEFASISGRCDPYEFAGVKLK